jgi:hypothetical protein
MLIDVLMQHLKDEKTRCLFGKWLETQSDEIRAAFDQLIKKPNKNISALWADINASFEGGVPYKPATLRSHMRGDCQCPKQ